MKVTPYNTTQEVFMDPFPIESGSLPFYNKEDAVSNKFAIEDKNTVKHKSAL